MTQSTNNSLKRIDVIIPALNEEQSLPLVLKELPPVRTIYVVDNGSTDRTAEVAKEFGATVVEQPQRGYGAACLKGMESIASVIKDGQDPPEIVVFIDGDFSDHPQEMWNLVKSIIDDEDDFVLGSRLLGNRESGAMPPQSIYGNKLACFLMNVLFRVRYTDLGPFRAIRYSSLLALGMSDENFGWTIEMQIKAAKIGLRIKEVPVSYRKRVGTSKISGTIRGTVKAGSKILFTIARYGFKKVRPVPVASDAVADESNTVTNLAG